MELKKVGLPEKLTHQWLAGHVVDNYDLKGLEKGQFGPSVKTALEKVLDKFWDRMEEVTLSGDYVIDLGPVLCEKNKFFEELNEICTYGTDNDNERFCSLAEQLIDEFFWPSTEQDEDDLTVLVI